MAAILQSSSEAFLKSLFLWDDSMTFCCRVLGTRTFQNSIPKNNLKIPKVDGVIHAKNRVEIDENAKSCQMDMVKFGVFSHRKDACNTVILIFNVSYSVERELGSAGSRVSHFLFLKIPA